MLKEKYYNLKQGIKNLIRWIPVVWRDRDYDQSFVFYILYHKFKHMEDYFRGDNCWGADAEKYADEIKVAKNLCKRLYEEDYLENALFWHDKKFESINLADLFEPSSEYEGYSIYVGDRNEARDKSFKGCCKHSDYMEKQDKDYLFSYLYKHLDGWWD